MSNRHQSPKRRLSSRGMSLAEILVAMTVFVIAAAVALILYNALSQSYKRGDNAADVQQNTRVAFEQLVTDARLGGFNYNPDGSSDRLDEQIEGAWDTAITFRGDFDFDDPTASVTPEASLGGGAENIVSIGNDEIVTYALAKPDGSGGTNLVFRADVTGVPRDGIEEVVTVNHIALVQNDPPYTLYRITVNANSTGVTRTPLADNIYSLRFRYFDTGDTQLSPGTWDDASDDIGGLNAARSTRASIGRIELSIVGMTQDPDQRYTDAEDPYPETEHHRKFTLTQDVTPRNLGYVGRPDLDVIPPDQPENLAACAGHCNSIFLTWDPASAEDLVSRYTALRGPTASSLGSPVSSRTNSVLVGGLVAGNSYYFRVRAEDLSGNLSPLSDLATPQPATVVDTTTPMAPIYFEITGGTATSPPAPPAETDGVRIRWDDVRFNTAALACDPAGAKLRDLKGYRLYRAESDGAPTSIVDPAYAYIQPDELPAGTAEVVDRQVVACRSYDYNIQAVDKCGNTSAAQPLSVDGMATTESAPVAPGALTAEPILGSAGAGGSDNVALTWARVTENTSGAEIQVDTYRLYRAEGPAGLMPDEALSYVDWNSADQLTPDVTVADLNAPSAVDTSVPALSDPGNAFYYRVSALTDCPSPYDEGDLSKPSEASVCDLGGTLELSPASGDTVAGSTTVAVAIKDAVDANAEFGGFVIITDSSGRVVGKYGSGAAPEPLPIVFTWSTASLPSGDYFITAYGKNSAGCAQSLTHAVTVVEPVPCCIAPISPVIGPQKGKISQRKSDVLVSLVNNCLQDVEISKINLYWTNLVSEKRLEHFCYDVPPDTLPEDCSPLIDFVPPPITPALINFTPVLTFPAERTDLNPMILGYQFDYTLVDDISGLGETISMDVYFRSTGSTADAQCRFQITTNPLDVAVVE